MKHRPSPIKGIDDWSVTASVLLSAGRYLDGHHGASPELKIAVMRHVLNTLHDMIYGDIRKQLIRLNEATAHMCRDYVEYERFEALLAEAFEITDRPKLEEIIEHQGATGGCGSGKALSSATPNPVPTFQPVSTGFRPRPAKPERQTAPSGSEVESFMDVGDDMQ